MSPTERITSRQPDRRAGSQRPSAPSAHRQPVLLALVLLGGTAGTAARYAITDTLVAPTGNWPTGTFAVNLAGAFLLGALLEHLVRDGPDAGWRRRWRLLAGTGFCGAFTTYSSLAVEMALLGRRGQVGLALAYGLASVVGGLLATSAGVALSAGRKRAAPSAGRS